MQLGDKLAEYIKNFSSYRTTMDLGDVAEILIIAVLLYYALVWMKTTRAWVLLKGLVVILIFLLLAYFFRMTTILWMAQNVLGFAVTALIVVLQPELRKALEELGKKNIISSVLPFDNNHRVDEGFSEKTINEITKACVEMGKVKTGALIVLERNTNLSEIVRTGTPVNSAVNLEVLGTIFYEGTPLHDGAAIIENGRIKAAGCVLPLSNNLDLGKDMGTRHRACLGIAENSDAIAVVVSEETGIISMAKNGVLIRHFDRQTLYTRLVDEMIPKETASEKAAADGWRGKVKSLLNWMNQKEEDEQQ